MTSDCIDENTALALIDGRIAPGSRQPIERHLEACDACRQLLAMIAQIDARTTKTGAGHADTIFAGSSLAPSTLAGPFRIEGAIGQGSAGTVYRATDTRSARVVALKHVVHPALWMRFEREASVLARLNHPAIVRYVEHGKAHGGMYLAMEWLDGEDLQQRLARGPLGWRAARVLGMRIASALAHAHALGCIHRDVTPRNVFLPNGRIEEAKLLDFGLVRMTSQVVDATRTQTVLGTPFYMSPEQVRDPRKIDARSDLFSLGVVLYEATSGMRPFESDQLFTLWDQIVNQSAPDLRGRVRESMPQSFVALIDALLAKDPRARPTSADVVERSLATMSDETSSSFAPPAMSSGQGTMQSPPWNVQPVVTAPPPPPESRRSDSGRAIAWVALGVAILTVGMVSIFLWMRLTNPTNAPSERAAATTQPATTALSHVEPAPSNAPAAPPPIPRSVGSVATAVAHPATTAPVMDVIGGPFFCGAADVSSNRGGHYASGPGHPHAVFVGGTCKTVLEDCVIDGTVQLMAYAELTLRRCRVNGDISLVGMPTLTLEATPLRKGPTIIGGKVIRK